MDRSQAIARLKAHERELRAAGIEALYLFGSTARGDARPDCDIDLACDIDASRGIGLLEMISMQMKLEDLVGRRVDLVERSAMRPRIARAAAEDSIRVF
jgi:predicted nucleotidyltransferase